MGRITTQRRDLDASHLLSQTFLGGVAQGAPRLGVPQPHQETTSYRSGRLQQGEQPEDPDKDLFNGGISGDTLSKLKASDRGEPQSSFDTGHEFTTTKSWIDSVRGISTGDLVPYGYPPDYKVRYEGIVFPHTADGDLRGWHDHTPFSSEAGYYGTVAISRTKPTNPTVNLALTLAELRREGLPRLQRLFNRSHGVSFQQALAGNYLSYEFGLKPLGSDIGALAHAVLDSESILAQYMRDSGKVVRRKMRFPVVKSTSHYVYPEEGRASVASNLSSMDAWQSYRGLSCRGKLEETLHVERQVWFSGAYTYHVPGGAGLLSRAEAYMDKANHLLGLEVNSETLWNLAPWSWLSDWNVNIGEIISNLESFRSDGLVLKYGYLMAQTYTRRDLVLTGPNTSTRNGFAGPWTISYHRLRKERVRAQPYGFGADPSSYTARQWAILVALGIAHSPGGLYSSNR